MLGGIFIGSRKKWRECRAQQRGGTGCLQDSLDPLVRSGEPSYSAKLRVCDCRALASIVDPRQLCAVHTRCQLRREQLFLDSLGLIQTLQQDRIWK